MEIHFDITIAGAASELYIATCSLRINSAIFIDLKKPKETFMELAGRETYNTHKYSVDTS